jgi:hypothetical protein
MLVVLEEELKKSLNFFDKSYYQDILLVVFPPFIHMVSNRKWRHTRIRP